MFAALTVSRHLEALTGWSIKRFVQAARRYRTIDVRIAGNTVPAEQRLQGELHDASQ